MSNNLRMTNLLGALQQENKMLRAALSKQRSVDGFIGAALTGAMIAHKERVPSEIADRTLKCVDALLQRLEETGNTVEETPTTPTLQQESGLVLS